MKRGRRCPGFIVMRTTVRIVAVVLVGGIILALLGCIAIIILAFAVPDGAMALMGIPMLLGFGGLCGGTLALGSGCLDRVQSAQSREKWVKTAAR